MIAILLALLEALDVSAHHPQVPSRCLISAVFSIVFSVGGMSRLLYFRLVSGSPKLDAIVVILLSVPLQDSIIDVLAGHFWIAIYARASGESQSLGKKLELQAVSECARVKKYFRTSPRKSSKNHPGKYERTSCLFKLMDTTALPLLHFLLRFQLLESAFVYKFLRFAYC